LTDTSSASIALAYEAAVASTVRERVRKRMVEHRMMSRSDTADARSSSWGSVAEPHGRYSARDMGADAPIVGLSKV